MGTHALTRVFNSNGQILLVMHRQYDGYIHGHGVQLAEFLTMGPIVNGFANKDEKVFNGMECLAAALVAHLKKSVGNHYIEPANAEESGYEYIYNIYQNRIQIKVLSESGRYIEKWFNSYADFKSAIENGVFG